MTIAPFDGLEFSGAKLALYLGPHLLVSLRDETPGILHPGLWDLPGGGRENGESPVQCVLRETVEEFGLRLCPGDLIWGRGFGAGPGRAWFFVAFLDHAALGRIRFGDEGQGWRLMCPLEYTRHPYAIAAFRDRLALSRAEMGQS